MKHETERTQFQRGFWNEKATENAHFHILGDMAMYDPSLRDEKFEEAGIRDGWKLALYLHPEADVLDLGCGIGRVMRHLSHMCRSVTGFDISQEMVSRSKDFLGEGNTRVHLTSGYDLAACDDNSVDLLYSLLCLIHIDKRSAWRYFAEFARCVRPNGLLFLQVHDIMTQEGLSKFDSVKSSDYPLEFYTEEEIRHLLAHHGIEVLHTERTAEFMNLICVRGSAQEWQESFQSDISIENSSTGFFREENIKPHVGGSRTLTLRNSGSQWRRFRLIVRVRSLLPNEDTLLYLRESCIYVPPEETTTIQLVKQEDAMEIEHSVNGGASRCISMSPVANEVLGLIGFEVHTALIPAGFVWDQITSDAFPGASIFQHCRVPS